MTVTESTIELSTPTGAMRTLVYRPGGSGPYPGIILFSEIFQITGALQRAGAFLAGHGYVVAVPEIYHELAAAGTVVPYDQPATGQGFKSAKELASYDGDSRALVEFLMGDDAVNGRIGAMGLCTGGHLALRAAMNPEVLAAACFYATDVASGVLGMGGGADTMERIAGVKAELLMIWGRQDTNIPYAARSAVRSRMEETGVNYQWMEFNANHAFFRDEGPRRDPALIGLTWAAVLELFHRRLAIGERA